MKDIQKPFSLRDLERQASGEGNLSDLEIANNAAVLIKNQEDLINAGTAKLPTINKLIAKDAEKIRKKVLGLGDAE